MHITITCQRDTESDEADRLLPYVARADFREISARDLTPEQAEAGARQICLVCLGHFVTPPMLIQFTVKRLP